jgi:tRNA(fMet)-specific endonuclease VapC
MARIASPVTSGPEQVGIYERMQESLTAAMKLGLLPFDDDAATVFVALRKEFRRLGTMDLKIAAICLVHDATLLTRNLVDFAKIPDLRVENWLD